MCLARARTALLVGLLMAAPALPAPVAPQSQFQWSCDFVEAWVDPGLGVDPPVSQLTSQINDPDHPYRKLQTAIDALILHLHATYPGVDQPQLMGVVHALPGLYGPWAGGSGDSFPIRMRDRVHVRGTSARACVIRGTGSFIQSVFWPETPVGGFRRDKEVLVDWYESQLGAPLPHLPGHQTPAWVAAGADAQEGFDSFTLQGGDVQMLIGDSNVPGTDTEFAGRVANCVFDMRDGWSTPAGTVISGPTFGLLVVAPFFDDQHAWGYLDRRFVIANNTFVMAEFARPTAAAVPTWINACRPDAVGIVDVINPGCFLSAGVTRDADPTLRGMSNLMLINNLFRTMPLPESWSFSTKPMAMLGIGRADARVRYSGTGAWRLSNVLDPERVGSDNRNSPTSQATFFSVPVTSLFKGTVNNIAVWDCHAVQVGPQGNGSCAVVGSTCSSEPLPSPKVELWNGHNQATGGVDPGFVGEYVNQMMSPQPSSPLKNARGPVTSGS